MIRNVLAIVAGFVLFTAVVFAVGLAASRAFPLPRGVDVTNAAAMKAAIAAMPAGALLSVIAGWSAGSFAGAFLATKISRTRRSAIVLGVAGTLIGALNNLSAPPPIWFWALTLVAFLPPALLAARLAARNPVPR